MRKLYLKSPSSASLIPRYILRLGQVAQKQQCPRWPNRKMYLEIKGADEGAFRPTREEYSFAYRKRLKESNLSEFLIIDNRKKNERQTLVFNYRYFGNTLAVS